MPEFTPTQGRYLAFIHAYCARHGYPPAESEIAGAMCVSPPSVNQMVKALERKGLILRHPGQPRSLEVLVPADEIPPWNNRQAAKSSTHYQARPSVVRATPAAPPGNLYVVLVFLTNGPISETFASKEISRLIEIRGDQTLEQLHRAIFAAYDRVEEQHYKFQLGRRPFDPKGPTYGLSGPPQGKKGKKRKAGGDAKVQVERIERAIPTVTYPRVIKRVGKSPPQYGDR